MAQTIVYDGPAGPVEVGYRLHDSGALAQWWVRAVDPEELDLAGLGHVGKVDDHPPVAVVSATPTDSSFSSRKARISARRCAATDCHTSDRRTEWGIMFEWVVKERVAS